MAPVADRSLRAGSVIEFLLLKRFVPEATQAVERGAGGGTSAGSTTGG